METIKIEGLNKNYGKNRGIIDINLCIKQGEIFGFIRTKWSTVRAQR